MHSTFFQKVTICMVIAFFAACLIQLGQGLRRRRGRRLNAGYKKDAISLTGHP